MSGTTVDLRRALYLSASKGQEIREAKICDRCHSLKQKLLLHSLWDW